MAKRKNKPSTAITITSPPSTPTTANQVGYWIIKIIISILILYIAHLLATKIANFIVSEIKKNVSARKKLIIYQLSEIIFYIVFGIGILVALLNLGVQTATIITLIGTMAVTVGLALQGILSNVFSGIYMALADNFQIGDTIRIYVPFIGDPIEGFVEDLNITYTIIRDSKTNQLVYVPNTSIAVNVVMNITRTKK